MGDVNMVATHADWTGKGVGRALLAAIVELADNWLGLACRGGASAPAAGWTRI